MVDSSVLLPGVVEVGRFVDQPEVGAVDRGQHVQRPVHLLEEAARVALVREAEIRAPPPDQPLAARAGCPRLISCTSSTDRCRATRPGRGRGRCRAALPVRARRRSPGSGNRRSPSTRPDQPRPGSGARGGPLRAENGCRAATRACRARRNRCRTRCGPDRPGRRSPAACPRTPRPPVRRVPASRYHLVHGLLKSVAVTSGRAGRRTPAPGCAGWYPSGGCGSGRG